MNKTVFFGYVILYTTALVAKIDIPVQNNLEIISFDYQAADFNDDDVIPTEEEVDSILEPSIAEHSERYETQEVIGQGEGPDALNPVNPNSLNRSRAGSFTDQIATYHNQTVHQNPIVIFQDQEDEEMEVEDSCYHRYVSEQEDYLNLHGRYQNDESNEENEIGWDYSNYYNSNHSDLRG